MKVVILCGGLGTRLKEETEYRPKPMVKMGSKPYTRHSRYGFKDFILCLGSVLPNSQISDYDITCEGESAESGGCPR